MLLTFSFRRVKSRLVTRKGKILSSITATFIFAALAAGWLWKTRAPILKEVALDIKAGVGARHAEKPFEKFLELRYGPMSDAKNRQTAFKGFFDPDHLEGMYRLVGHMKPNEKTNNIGATAVWLANYRAAMSPEERLALAQWIRSEEGRANIQRASAIYRSREIAYRAATEPVITELMTTLGALQKYSGE